MHGEQEAEKDQHLQPQSATICMTCMSNLDTEICRKMSKTRSSRTLSIYVHLLPRLRTPLHQLSRQQPPPTSTHSESLTHTLLKIFSFSLLNTIKLIEMKFWAVQNPLLEQISHVPKICNLLN